MNEVKLLSQTGDVLNLEYGISVSEKELVGEIGSTEINLQENAPEGLAEDTISIEFNETLDKADKYDYQLAAACGWLSGAFSILWSKKFSLDGAHDWGNKKADDIVKAFAKGQGYKKDDLEGAIVFLEKKFPMAGDALTDVFGGGKQHHLRDFSHHPTPLGLVCSIFMQFTGVGARY